MRKLLLIILITNALSVKSQNECDMINKDYSVFTKEMTIVSDTIQLENFSMYLRLYEKKGHFPKLEIVTHDKECIDSGARIILLLEDNTVIDRANFTYAYNCKGLAGYPINDKKTRQIKKLKVVGVRLETENNVYEDILTDEQSQFFFNISNCAFDRKKW